LPDAKMLHQFRDRLDLIKLRAINRRLAAPFFDNWDSARKSLAIIDSTDLPAATHSFKKKSGAVFSSRRGHRGSYHKKRSEPMVHRIQKTHTTFVASTADRFSAADPSDNVGRTSQSRRCVVSGEQHSLLPQAFGFYP